MKERQMTKRKPGQRGIRRLFPAAPEDLPMWESAFGGYEPQKTLLMIDGWIIESSTIDLATGNIDVKLSRVSSTTGD